MKFKNGWKLWLCSNICGGNALVFLVFFVALLDCAENRNLIGIIISLLMCVTSICTLPITVPYEGAWDMYSRAKREVKSSKYLVFSYSTFVSTYNLMCTRHEETGQNNPFDLRFTLPYYDSTFVIFDDALDWLKYYKFKNSLSKKEKQDKVINNLDVRAYNKLKEELRKESERHNTETDTAIKKMKEIALTLGTESKEDNTGNDEVQIDKGEGVYYKICYRRNFDVNNNQTLYFWFSSETESIEFVKYLYDSNHLEYRSTELLARDCVTTLPIVSAKEAIGYEDSAIKDYFSNLKKKEETKNPNVFRVYYYRITYNAHGDPRRYSHRFMAEFLSRDLALKAVSYLQSSTTHVYDNYKELYVEEPFKDKDFNSDYSYLNWYCKESDWEEAHKRVQKSKEEEYDIRFPLKVYLIYQESLGKCLTRENAENVKTEVQEYTSRDAIKIFFNNLFKTNNKISSIVVYKMNPDGTFGDNITNYFNEVCSCETEQITISGGKGNQKLTSLTTSKNSATLDLMSGVNKQITKYDSSNYMAYVDFGQPVITLQ